MKLLVLTAFIAAVSSGRVNDQTPQQSQQWPWQSGKQYRYEVESHTLTHLKEGASSGNAFKANFIVRVRAPGQLQAKLERPQYATFHEKLANNMALPTNLKYQPVQNLDKPFEINVEGGRVLSLNLPSSFSLPQENLLKGLISSLQVDLSTYRHTHNPQDTYDKETQQGVFKKMEADITGDCETLYSVSPVASEWRRELPRFASQEDPIEITKSKNHGHCHHRVAYHFGVPAGAEWTGTAHRNNEKQFITHALVSRILAGKQGPIYKTETISSVHVHPHLFGKQKAEVHSNVRLELVSVEQDSGPEWQKPEGQRQIQSLLYSMSSKQIATHDYSSASSSSSESHEHWQHQAEEPKQRARRSANSDRFNAHHSSSSSSSSDSSSAYINDDTPAINEPAYAALYMTPQAHGDRKQNTVNAQKLIQDLAQQLQNPNNMPKSDFLSKFNILVRVIASMSYDQLTQTSRGIEVGKSSNNNVKADMWMIFRDAVAQAGTPPALQQIKTWILSKKLQGEEAAQVVATLSGTLRYPTKEIMAQFFELAMNPEVKQQDFLGNAALISATRFIRMGQVDNDTAHFYYPTHMYGRLARKHDEFVTQNILPRLSKELKESIEKGENHKAQVYVKAIGNLGHREILQVFAPYLEGQIKVSNHLRVQMVNDLSHLAQQKDKYARAVLYSIVRNTAEPYEFRVAAILNIFRAHPTAAMMQVMAQMTHDDPSVQVRAVLKSGIEFASGLRNPLYWELAKTAKSVQDMVTKEKLGYQYSTESFFDYYENDEEPNYFRHFSYIGSKDTALPKYQRMALRSKNGAWTEENSARLSFSSVQQLLEFIKNAMFAPKKSQAQHKYSAEKISEMLRIKPDEKKPLEASFQIDIFNQERFFSFDEEELNRLVKDVTEYLKEVEKGVDKHYTKVLTQKQVSVMFPVAMGMPFIYKYKEPTVIHIHSKAKGRVDSEAQSNNGYYIKMDKEVQFTYARNLDGSVGFMDTLSDQYASAGVINKIQINLPVKMNIEGKQGQVKVRVEPLRPDQDTTIVHYSVWPYTANQKKDSLVPHGLDPTTKVVERPRKVVSIDTKFGQQAGAIFHLQGYSYSTDYQSLEYLYREPDLLSNIIQFVAQRDVAQTHYNLRYLAKQSPNKAVTFTVAYETYYNQKQSGELGEASQQKATQPNSPERREELAKRVKSGINTARVRVVDIGATFEGPQKQEYVFTAAIADSFVDQKIQAAVYAGRNSAQHGNEQFNAVGKVQRPEISPLDLNQALKRELKMTYEADIKYGPKARIQIQGTAERSMKQAEQLRGHPLVKVCQQEIANGNKYQYACHKMLIKAQAPDIFKASVTYKDAGPTFTTVTYRAYEILKNLKFWDADQNPMKKLPEGKIELQAEASYIDSTLRFEMESKYGVLKINNVQIPKVTPYSVAFYQPLTPYERTANYYTNYQNEPFCSVDGSKIKTFSTRSYSYTLSKAWHVVMHDQSNERGKWDDLVILAKRPSEKQQEIYMSYKTETGKDLEIEIKPGQSNGQHEVKVQTNGKKVSEGDLTIYYDEVSDAPLLQYHQHPDGVLMLRIASGQFRFLYDGERLVILSEEHRSTTRGICGENSGEPRDDYKTPEGLVDQPEHYGASYALDSESDPKTHELKKEAKEKAYQQEHKYTAILRSDEQWRQAVEQQERDWGSQKVYRSKSYQKQQQPCKLQQQVQYHENHGEICITTTPLPACQSYCQAEGYKVQAAQVICASKADAQFRAYKEQIHQGQNPQVSGPQPKVEQYRVPTSCKA